MKIVLDMKFSSQPHITFVTKKYSCPIHLVEVFQYCDRI
jgi:hypothetical protein